MDYAAAHIQHMQTALMQMNLQLHHVVTDITGVTGLAIIRAIVAGERDPNALAAHRDPRCHATVDTVGQGWELSGGTRLRPSTGTGVVRRLSAEGEGLRRADRGHPQAAEEECRVAQSKLLPIRQHIRQPNAPAFDARGALHAILGVDLTQIGGPGPSLALKLVGERGTTLEAWPTAKHFTSWLALAPHNKSPAGCCRHERGAPAIGLHLCAYVDPGATYYEDRYRQPVPHNLQRRAKSLGFILQPLEPSVQAGVS